MLLRGEGRLLPLGHGRGVIIVKPGTGSSVVLQNGCSNCPADSAAVLRNVHGCVGKARIGCIPTYALAEGRIRRDHFGLFHRNVGTAC